MTAQHDDDHSPDERDESQTPRDPLDQRDDEPLYLMIDNDQPKVDPDRQPASNPPSSAPPAYVAAPPEAPRDGMADEARRRREYIFSLLRGRLHWAVLLALVLSVSLGVLGYVVVQPLYRSVGMVKIEPNPLMYSVDRPTGVGFAQEQVALIGSEMVARRAMAEQSWIQRENDAVEYDVADFQDAIAVSLDPQNRLHNVYEISFEAENPFVAAAGVNATLAAYRRAFSSAAESQVNARIAHYQSLINSSRRDIENQLAIRRTIITDSQEASLEERSIFARQRMLELREQLDDVVARLEARTPLVAEDETPTLQQIIEADPVLTDLQARIDQWTNEINVLTAQGLGPSHYRVERVQNQIDVLSTKKESRIATIQSDGTEAISDPELEELRRFERMFTQQLAEVTGEYQRLTETQIQLASIRKEIAGLEQTIADAGEEMRRKQVEIETVREAMDIIRRGAVPLQPYNEGQDLQMAVVGSVGGLMLGFGLVMFVGVLDRRLRHANDAQMGLPDARMLGILPTLSENLDDSEQAEKASHAVHHVRTLLQIANGGTARVFSVTSPAAGSGKSSLCVALGLSFAASESRTLVIDCDLVGAGLTRRVGAVVNRTVEAILREDTTLTESQISQAMRTSRQRGQNLKDTLIDQGLLTKKDLARLNRRQADSALGVLDACHGRPFTQCVAHTGIDNFFVLPIGAARPQDAGLFSPKAMRNLIARAREEYDIVLIDTGPSLGSLEASMASAESDATVLVVSRGDAKSMVARAYEHLRSVGANVVGVVFNHALEADLGDSSYTSVMSQERRGEMTESQPTADPAIAARFGPLGSAVAAYGTPSRTAMIRPRRRDASTNGNHVSSGNGAASGTSTH